MAATHTVKQGEHLSGIAEAYGYLDFSAIWNHPLNESLKKRRNPNVLYPGDQLYIPDKQLKTAEIGTARVHTFVIPNRPLALQITVKDMSGRPLANTECRIEIDGSPSSMKTDERGKIRKEIAKRAKQGVLKLPTLGMEFPFRIGDLDPVEEEPGWEARLANLGYYRRSKAVDNSRLRCAIEEFQCEAHIKVTGELDNATKAKLKEAHGS